MNGEECMFSHESLTEDTQELLDKVVIRYFKCSCSVVVVVSVHPD